MLSLRWSVSNIAEANQRNFGNFNWTTFEDKNWKKIFVFGANCFRKISHVILFIYNNRGATLLDREHQFLTTLIIFFSTVQNLYMTVEQFWVAKLLFITSERHRAYIFFLKHLFSRTFEYIVILWNKDSELLTEALEINVSMSFLYSLMYNKTKCFYVLVEPVLPRSLRCGNLAYASFYLYLMSQNI